MLRLFLHMGGWLAVLPLLVVVAAAFSSAGSGANAERLRAEGVEARATITGKFEEKRFRPGVRRSEPDHVLQFSYSSGSVLRGDFRAGAGQARVSKAFYDSLAEGDTAPLRYLAEDDSVFELEPGSVSGEASNALQVAGIIVLICLPLFVLVWRRAARAMRIRDRGRVAEGRVERRVPRGIVEVLEFSFSDAQGQPRSGRTLPRRASGFGELRAGAALRVLYDAEDPRLAFWAEDLGERAAPG